MIKVIKIIFGIIIFLVLAVVIFAGVIIGLNWSNKPKKQTFTATKKMSELNTLTINVDVKDSYVVVKRTKTEYASVTYYGSKTREYECDESVDLLNNSTITVKGYQTGKWYNRILLTFKFTKVYETLVEVPDDANVFIKTDNGNVRFEDVDATILTAETNNGGIILNNVSANMCGLQTVNGNIEVTGSDTGTFTCKTKKGRIVLDKLSSLLTIDASTDSGNISLNKTYATGNFKLHTGKGNITGTIKLLSASYYKITATAKNGTCNIENTSSGIADLTITTDNGNIDVELKEV